MPRVWGGNRGSGGGLAMRWGMALFYLFMWHMQPTMRIARRCAVLPLPRTLLPPHALPLGQTDGQTDTAPICLPPPS